MAKDEQDAIIDRIKLMLSTLSEPLKQSMDFYYSKEKPSDSKNSTLENFRQALISAKEKIVKIQKRGCFVRYMYAQNDLETLNGCASLIFDAVQMIKVEKDIIELSLAKQDLEKKTSQMETIKNNISEQGAQEFWKVHIAIKKTQEPVYEFATKFQQVEFQKLKNRDSIKKQYAISKLLELMDEDGSGFVDLEEFNKFYQKNWSTEEKKNQIIQQILEEQESPLSNTYQIMISILEECGMQKLITKFLSLKIDSKIFLTMDYNSLSQITTSEQAIKINQSIQKHNNYIKKIDGIKEFLDQVRPQMYQMMDEYKRDPQDWKENYTGVCRVKMDWHHGDYICRATNGVCWGPYVVLTHEERVGYSWWGYLYYFHPGQMKKEHNSFYCLTYLPDKGNISRKNLEQYGYQQQDRSWVLNIKDPFTKIYYEGMDFLTPGSGDLAYMFKHGQHITVDQQGNQVRQYFLYDSEVTYQQFIQDDPNKNQYYKRQTFKINY